MTRPMKIFGPLALAFLSHSTALALPQRHPGLWRQTTETKVKYVPELTPEERSIVMKPGSLLDGSKHSIDACVTTETNAYEKMVLERSKTILNTKSSRSLKLLHAGLCETEMHETAFTSTSKTECRKTGNVTSGNTVWKSDVHFDAEIHSKTFTEGRSVEATTRIAGDFVGPKCGNVRAPFFPLSLDVKGARGPGEPLLFDAFNRYCIETKADYDQIAKIANAPASIFRREWQANAETTTRWQVGGPFTYLTAHTGKSEFTRRGYDSCEMSTQNVDAASLEAMRQWLGPKSMPTLGWSQDFLWGQDKRTPVSKESASVAGKVVWELRVSKSLPGEDTRFILSRPTQIAR